MKVISFITIPRVVSPQGLIASARTYRLVLNEAGLHVIHLGRAMGMKVKSGDAIADALAGKMVNKMEQNLEIRLAEAEKALEGVPLSELVRRKKSFLVTPGAGTTVTALVKPNLPPRLIVKSPTGKLKLVGPEGSEEDFQQIAVAFQSAN